MRTKLTVALSLSLGLLAGCSGTKDDAVPEVVSLQAPSSAPAGAAPQAAPVIRPDTTSEEQARMSQPWMHCLKKNGVPMRTTDNGLLDIGGGNTKETNGRIIANTNQKVVAACGKLKPILAPELDEEKNPYWADDNDNYHECLVENGSDLVKKDGTWVPGPTWQDEKPDEARDRRCQIQAFDGKRG